MKSKIHLALVALSVIIAVSSVPHALANRYTEQINNLSQQNSQNQDAQEALEIEAASLKDKVNRLQADISGLETKISENQARNDEVKQRIAVAEQELEKQKDLLGESIKAMYLDGQITTLEMLATSKELSDFVDKEQYHSSVKDKVKNTMDKISALKAELDSQKAVLDKLIADQKSIQAQLDAQRAEQSRLLGLNQAEQAAYEQKINANNSKIASLRRQQAAENARQFGSVPGTGANCGGGYPGSAPGPWGRWGCNYPLDNTIDNWGMYNRECVSYTAFKVASSGRFMPYWGGHGNAKLWDDNARAAGIPVDYNPRPGDVGISNSGTFGHAFYVEQVSSDGSIYISDYNQQFDGRYREYWISGSTVKSRGFVFIHFR